MQKNRKKDIRQTRGVSLFSVIFHGISNRIYVMKNMVNAVDTCTPDMFKSSRNPYTSALATLDLRRQFLSIQHRRCNHLSR